MFAIIPAVIFTIAGQVTAPPPRDQASVTDRTQIKETATARGRVTDRESGAPLAHIVVSLIRVTPEGVDVEAVRGSERNSSDDPMRSATTGPDGTYQFAGITPGGYRLFFRPSESRTTHLAQALGQDNPWNEFTARRPPHILLTARESRDDLDIALSRAFAIEGQVVDDRGEPISNADVGVRLVEPTGWVPSGGRVRSTDDRGFFRLFGLPPGAYQVCAQASDYVSSETSGVRLGPGCYPSDSADAPVTLSSTDVGGVVIRLRLERTYVVRGTAVDSSGKPIERGNIGMMTLGRMASPPPGVETLGGGAFVVRSVEPGDYILEASTASGDDGREREIGYMRLTVSSGDIEGALVTTAPMARLVGRMVFEGGKAPPAASIRMNSEIDQKILQLGLIPLQPVPLRQDFTFELKDLWGPRLIEVSGLPKEWVLKTVVYRGVDVTDTGVEFKSSTDPALLEVTVTNHGASLTGRVSGSNGSAPDAFVVLVPADPKRRRIGAGLPQTRIREDGTFTCGPVRPGEYIVAAVDPVSGRLAVIGRAEALERLEKVGTRVTLGPGERQTLDLSVVTLR